MQVRLLLMVQIKILNKKSSKISFRMQKFKLHSSAVLVAILLLASFFCEAQRIIPIPTHVSGGRLDFSTGLAIFISANVVFISIFIIRVVLFLIKKPKITYLRNTINISFVEYTIWSGFEYYIDINTISFVIFNVFALFIQIIFFVQKMIA